jgi:hypothetical protein
MIGIERRQPISGKAEEEIAGRFRHLNHQKFTHPTRVEFLFDSEHFTV